MNYRKPTNSWKLSNIHCTIPASRKKKKLINDFPEFNEISDTTYPKQWDTLKAVLRGKFIALSAHMKKLENSHTREITAHWKALEQKETNFSQEE